MSDHEPSLQSLQEDCFGTAVNLPVGHVSHANVDTGLNMPAIHGIHEVAFGSTRVFVTDPGVHGRHTAPEVMSVGRNDPTGQLGLPGNGCGGSGGGGGGGGGGSGIGFG